LSASPARTICCEARLIGVPPRQVKEMGTMLGGPRIARMPRYVSLLLVFVLLGACNRVTNSPHPTGSERTNTFFTAFQERSPKYLDPTASYNLDETPYTYSIYEPPYRFHYLKRPYEIAPRAAEQVAKPQ